MRQQRKPLVWIGGMLLVLGSLALAGCSVTGLASKPTPTSTPSAATILEGAVNVQKTGTKDVEFSMNLSLTTNGTAVTGDIKGTETTSPNRVDLVFTNLTAEGQQFSGEIITDAATNATYVKFTNSSFTEIPVGQWIETTGGGSINPLPIDPTQFADLSQMTGAKLVGTEKLDGIDVWHLQATKTVSGSTSQIDIYIRQDNNQLYELVANETGTSTGSVTLKITGVNTGATISLPPPSAVATP
jgi:hypothetical protein